MNNQPVLKIENLHVAVGDKEIVKGINLEIYPGETHALMGPNGSGKSTLSYALAGHPNYKITNGRILLAGQDLRDFKPHERAKLGLFLAFQYPTAIPGVSIANLLRTALKATSGREIPVKEFRSALKVKMAELDIEDSFIARYVNDGFSGGEKKRLEVLQMAVLSPKLAILDEPDSGLDIDSLKVVAEGINRQKGQDKAILLITHYQRILNYVEPAFVHIISEGKIVKSGSMDLAKELETKGYEKTLA